MSLRSHIIIAFGAFALLLGLGVQTAEQSPRLKAALTQNTVDIGIEHSGPLSMRFEYTTRNEAALVRIEHGGNEHISISVPENWKRGEVSGAPLSEIRKDEPVFGFVRWHLPARTGVTFFVKQAPEHVVIHNPSQAAIKVITTKVNLSDETVERNIVLIQDSAVKIW